MREITWMLEYHHIDGRVEEQYFNEYKDANEAFLSLGEEEKDIYAFVLLGEVNWAEHSEKILNKISYKEE